jgi:HD-GYP domain-containing protein (c-di-GMP phosphodiesterase class II)
VDNPRIRLQGLGADLEGKSWESDRLLRVGRAGSVEMVLADASLSRRHAEIVLTEMGWMVRDLGSTNGTFLNGIRVGQVERKIQERDVLQFGNVVTVVTALIDPPPAGRETPFGHWQVQGTTQNSWEEALQALALDLTRRSRPGEQLLTLLRSGHHLYQVASLDDLLHHSLRDALALLKAQRGAILLADEVTGEPLVRVVVTARPDVPRDAHFSTTLVGRCLRRGESLLCNDTHTDVELLRAQSVAGGAMSSVICALLRTPRQRLGVLHLDRGPADDPFSLDDLQLADGIAAGMSASVASAQLIQEKQRNVFIQTVIALAQTLELRDPETSGHTQRVTDYVLMLAEEMKLPAAERRCLQIAGPLHDIGKIGVDDTILRKEEALTPGEFERMKAHPLKGAALLETIPDLTGVVPVVRHHHERWDGKGYPDNLAGTHIPRMARLIAVADTFDALTFDSCYRRAVPLEDALEQVRAGAGSQFDPECAEAFLSLRPRLEQHFQERAEVRKRLDRAGGLSEA